MPITHEWNGTILTITSDSGTSSCDLKGDKGDDGARGAQGIPGSAVVADSSTLGGLPASEYALKTDIPSLEGYAQETYVDDTFNRVPRFAYNLLDNSDFTNPVNQRGKISYAGAGYAIDRWINGTSGTTTTLSNIGLEIAHTGTTGYSILAQHFTEEETTRLQDKTLTGVIYYADGTYSVNSGVPSAGTTYFGNAQFYINDGLLKFRILHNQYGENIIVKAVALYEGEYTKDNIPTYVSKGYAAELYACRRYYRYFKNNLIIGYMHGTTTYTFPIDGYGMVGIPTITDFAPSWLYMSDGKSAGVSNIGAPTNGSQGRASSTLAVEQTSRLTGTLYCSYALTCEP